MKTIENRLSRLMLALFALSFFVSVAEAQSLYDAAKRGDLASVARLLKQGGNPDVKDGDGVTALMYASEQGHAKVVEFLLKQGANPNIQDSGYGMTALMVSAAEGHAEVVRLLLDAKADVNMKDNNLGATALLGAAEYGYIEIIEALIASGADVNARSKLNRTALMMSATNGHTSTVEALLSAGADANVKDLKYGATALMGAASNGHIDIVKALIQKGAKLDEKNNNGMTALEMAKAKGRTGVASTLEMAKAKGRTGVASTLEKAISQADFLTTVPADALFCVRVNNLDGSVGALDQFLAGVAPVPPMAMMVRRKLAEVLGDASMPGVDMAGAFGLFGVVKDADSDPEVFMVVPVSDMQALMSSPAVSKPGADGVATITSQSMGSEQEMAMMPADGFIIVCPIEQRELLAGLAKPASPLAQALTSAEKAAATSAPLWARVNLVKINALYGDEISGQFEQMQNMTAMMGSAPGGSAFMKGYADGLQSLMKQSRAVDISLQPKVESLTLSMMLVALPGSELASTLSLGPAPKGSPELQAYLEDGAMANIYMRMNRPLLKKAYMSMLDLFVEAPGQPADEIAKAKALIVKAMDACGDTTVCTMKAVPGAKPPFAVSYVVQVKDAKAMKEVIKEGTELMNEGMFAKMYKDMGMETTYVYQPDAVTHSGIAIDSWKMSLKVTDANSMEGQMVTSMYGSGMSGLVAFTDSLALSSAGGDAEASLKRLIDSVKAGGPKGGSTEFKAAAALVPDAANADMICTYNYLRLFKAMGGMMPIPGFSDAVSKIPDSKSNLAIAARAGDGSVSMDVVLPKAHAKEMVDAVMQIQGGGQHQDSAPTPISRSSEVTQPQLGSDKTNRQAEGTVKRDADSGEAEAASVTLADEGWREIATRYGKRERIHADGSATVTEVEEATRVWTKEQGNLTHRGYAASEVPAGFRFLVELPSGARVPMYGGMSEEDLVRAAAEAKAVIEGLGSGRWRVGHFTFVFENGKLVSF